MLGEAVQRGVWLSTPSGGELGADRLQEWVAAGVTAERRLVNDSALRPLLGVVGLVDAHCGPCAAGEDAGEAGELAGSREGGDEAHLAGPVEGGRATASAVAAKALGTMRARRPAGPTEGSFEPKLVTHHPCEPTVKLLHTSYEGSVLVGSAQRGVSSMSVVVEELTVVTVNELLALKLNVPNYQRPYTWEPKHALELLDDVIRAAGPDSGNGGKRTYALGSVILHRTPEGLDIVDGQQRLLTLLVLRSLLQCDATRKTESAVGRVRARLAEVTSTLPPLERVRISRYLGERCTLVRIVTTSADEAFRFFDAQNYRGKALDPHDLLKAHHLRAMAGHVAGEEKEIEKVVERWESVESKELADLFERYLHRIARWCRGEPALDFTDRHIDVFKGVGGDDTAPYASYLRRAASGAEPGWSRFQLDLAVPAGAPFFEMIDFVLQKRKWLVALAREDRRGGFRTGRHAYLAELYECALLYVGSRFGEDAASRLSERLFRWAYALRLDQERVSWRTVNKYALGGGTVADSGRNAYNLFARIRNASSVRELEGLEVSVAPSARSKGDEALSNRLQNKEEK